MRRNPVSSSIISSVGYDFGSRTLEIEFKRGGVYQYEWVPHSVYLRMIGTSSVGEYFHEFIKDKYEFRKI